MLLSFLNSKSTKIDNIKKPTNVLYLRDVFKCLISIDEFADDFIKLVI